MGTNGLKLGNVTANGVYIKNPDPRVIRFTEHETIFFYTNIVQLYN